MDYLLRLQLMDIALYGPPKVMRAGAQGRGRRRCWTPIKRKAQFAVCLVNVLVRIPHGITTVYLDLHLVNTHLLLCSPSIQGTQPPHVEEPPDEADTGDEEGDITPPPTTPTSPMHTRRSAPYSYVSSRSRRANSPTLTATTLDTGYISAGTATTTGRGLTKIATSGIPPARRARSRASSVVHKTGGRIVYEGGLEDDEDDYEYIYQETRPPLARGREVVLRDFVPTKQRAAHQQAPPQYVFVYEGEEEYEDGELYYTPAPPQDSHALVRRPAQPKAMSFRVPNTNTDVTITVQEAAPPPVRYTLARPRPAERVVYVPEPTRRTRTAVPRIHEVGDDGYTIAGDDEYEDVPVIVKPVPKRRAYIRE